MQKFPSFTGLSLLATCAAVIWHVAAPGLQGDDAAQPASATNVAPGESTSVAPPAATLPDPSRADGASPAAPFQSTGNSAQAAQLLHESKQRLFAYSSVQADIREFVALGDRRFEAVGRYIAGPFNPLPQLRLEYHVRVGNTEGTLHEICDGQILRTEKTIGRVRRADAVTGEQSTISDSASTAGGAASSEPTSPESTADRPFVAVTRRDVRRVLEAVQKHGPTPETILQAELGIGGLPALLTSIERAMVFDAVLEEPLGGRRCHVLQGRWRPEFLAELERHFAHFKKRVDPFLPQTVRIHLDAETVFPVRISYWPAPPNDGRALTPLLTLEFTNIRLNEAVPAEYFQFVPTGSDERDTTGEFIEAIKAAAQTPPAPSTVP